MGEHARTELISRYSTLTVAEQEMLLNPADRIVIPLLYPVNINSW